MNRSLAFILALCCAFLSVSSACMAAPSDWIHFTLEPSRGGGDIRADFREAGNGRDRNNWQSSFPASAFVGLDLAGFRTGGTRPLRFAIARQAGRLDCAGHGGESYASGNCGFTADPGFTQLLAARGIGRPSREQAFSLMALDVRRELIDAVAAAHYPTPTIDNLIEMTAVGVDGRYIADLSRLGYRPKSVHNLVEFRALDITPDWIGGFQRIGYGDLPADDLVQLKALDVTPDYVQGFERIGYRNLPADTLVQLKALDITPEFAREMSGATRDPPSVHELVDMKVLGRRR
jgi:hypothetical protein